MSKFFVLFFFLFTPFLTFAQKDSNQYYTTYATQIIPRFIYSYKNQQFNLAQNPTDSTTRTNTFETGNQNFMGVDISYKWITLGYSFSLNPENTRQNIDLRLSTAYQPFQLSGNYTKLRNLNYAFYDINFDGEFDTLTFSRERNISLSKLGVKMDYVFNYKKYCYSAGFTQGGLQTKSKGSVLASAGAYYDNFDFTRLSSLVKNQFDSVNGFNAARLARADFGIGYGYNWLVYNNLTVAFTEIPNIGIQEIRTYLNAVKQERFLLPNFTNQFKLGVLWTYRKIFIGASAISSLTVIRIGNTLYSNNYITANSYFGYIFETKRWRLKKKI